MLVSSSKHAPIRDVRSYIAVVAALGVGFFPAQHVSYIIQISPFAGLIHPFLLVECTCFAASYLVGLPNARQFLTLGSPFVRG